MRACINSQRKLGWHALIGRAMHVFRDIVDKATMHQHCLNPAIKVSHGTVLWLPCNSASALAGAGDDQLHRFLRGARQGLMASLTLIPLPTAAKRGASWRPAPDAMPQAARCAHGAAAGTYGSHGC